MLQAVAENVNREQHYPVKSGKDRNKLPLENRELTVYMVQEGKQITLVHIPGLRATFDVQRQDLHNLL